VAAKITVMERGVEIELLRRTSALQWLADGVIKRLAGAQKKQQ